MKLLAKVISSIAMLTVTAGAMAEVKVIAHTSTSDRNVPANVIADIYLGVANTLPSGINAVPIDQAEGQAARGEFYSKATKKDGAQLKAYWSRLIFTGKGNPPQVVHDNDEVVAMVKSTPGLIGYVSGSTDTSGVRVLLTLP